MDGYSRLLLVQLLGLIVLGCLGDEVEKEYNPLGSLYQEYRITRRSFHLSDAGSLSASIIDYKIPYETLSTKPECIRVLVFMAYGVILDNIRGACDTPDSSAGLITRDSSLRYYNQATVRQEAPGRFVSIVRTAEKEKCNRKVLVLEENSGHKIYPSHKVTVEYSLNRSCDDLDPLPPMLLLSSGEGYGKFSPVSEEWMSYNSGEPLGLLSREYRYLDKCFRLVVITSELTYIRSFKLTCGAIHGVTSTDRSLRLGDTLYATLDSPDRVTFILKAGNTFCIKKMNSFDRKKRVVRDVLHKDTILTMKDNDCRRLIKGEVEDTTVGRNIVSDLKTSPIKNKFKQEILKPFTPSGELFDFNIARGMGMMVQTYTNDVDKKQINVVTLVAGGVLVLPVIVDAGIPKPIVIQDKAVYYDKDVAFTKLRAQHGYQVLKRIDVLHCWRKLFMVKEKDGSLEEINEVNTNANGPATNGRGDVKEAPTINPKGNIVDDEDCKNLIGGLHLKKIEGLPSNEKKN